MDSKIPTSLEELRKETLKIFNEVVYRVSMRQEFQ